MTNLDVGHASPIWKMKYIDYTMPDGWVPEVPDGWAVDEVPDTDNTKWAEWQLLWAVQVGTIGEFPTEMDRTTTACAAHCIARCCRATRDDGARGVEAYRLHQPGQELSSELISK